MSARKKVVIVGGGFGGLEAAKALAKVDVDVTLVDRENHHLFQPLLYQVATAGLNPGSIAVPIRSIVGRQENTHVVLGEAVGVDKTKRTLHLADGTSLSYDWLIVAAGAKTNFFGNEEWGKHAHGLKSVRDAIRIRERVLLAFEAAERETNPVARKKLLTFVVIGGGPTGVEMAGAISELGRTVLADDYQRVSADDIRVVLIEMGPRVLAPFDEDLSLDAARQLEELGVELKLGARVTDVDEHGVEMGDERIESSIVVWASGVKPVSLAEKLDVELSRRGQIRVDEHCAVLGHSEMFAIGDIAAFIPEGEEHALPGLAPVALQQGRHVAKMIQADLRRRPRTPYEYFDKGMMATVGRSRAVVQHSLMKLSGLLAWLAWCFIHVMYLVGFRNRFIVLSEWTWNYLTYKRGTRLVAHVPRGAGAAPDPLGAIRAARPSSADLGAEASAAARDEATS